MSCTQAQPQQCRTVEIQFLETNPIRRQVDDGDSDEEVDEEDDDFELDSDAVRSARPPTQLVTILLLQTHQKIQIKTRALIFTYNWVRAKIQVPEHGVIDKHLHAGRFWVIEYSLDPSSGERGVNAISLLFNSAKMIQRTEESSAEDPIISSFCQYLRSECQRNKDVRLTALPELLDSFESCYNEQDALFLRQMLQNSNAGRVFLLAVNLPKFFALGPVLMPKKFKSLLIQEEDSRWTQEKKSELHTVLNNVIEDEPWKMGFEEVLLEEFRNRQLQRIHWFGLESPLALMKRAPFYPDLTSEHKDALHVYDLVKQCCLNHGHTYVLQSDVEKHHRFHNSRTYHHNITAFYSALTFLESHGVVVSEVEAPRELFHLKRYWRAEERIIDGFKTLMKKNSAELQGLNERLAEAPIQFDETQLTAAQMIAANPITIISGRGGTGKTEVVTTVLSAVKEMIEQQKKDENQGEYICRPVLHGVKHIIGQQKKDENQVESGNILSAVNHIVGQQKKDENQVKTDDKGCWESCNKNKSCEEDDEEQDFFVGDHEEQNKDAASVVESNGMILYTAPTGKAAAVIRKRIKKKAFTIHQVIMSFNTWIVNRNGPWKFAETRILAVDECSMVALELFSSLINCLVHHSRLEKVVLLGDRLQLPSISPGNLMHDLFRALQRKGYAVELEVNHRSEGSLIFENAKRISMQQMPQFDRDKGFIILPPRSESVDDLPSFVRRGARKLEQVTQRTKRWKLEKEHKTYLPLEKKEVYLSLLFDFREEFNLNCPETSQLIAFRRKECDPLNEICCKVYNNHFMYKESDPKRPRSKRKVDFAVGDKIMTTKNNDVHIYLIDEENEEDLNAQLFEDVPEGEHKNEIETTKERFMNGSVYIIRKEGKIRASDPPETKKTSDESFFKAATPAVKTKRVEYYKLDDLSGEMIYPNRRMLKVFCRLTHAYATTIHKFQGSESDTIVYGVSDCYYENWQHVYTAVTRAKKKLIVVGKWEDLQKAIRRSPRPRQTGLEKKVVRLLTRPPSPLVPGEGHRASQYFDSDDDQFLFESQEAFEKCVSIIDQDPDDKRVQFESPVNKRTLSTEPVTPVTNKIRKLKF